MQTSDPAAKDMPRVLHIDFPAAILKLLETTFQNRGLVWETCDSGVQGFHMALVQNYNLILLALRENTIDGLRIIKGLRRAGITTPIVVFMPSRDLEQRRAELSRYPSVIACLAKPLDLRQVEKAMEFLRHPPSLKPNDKAKLLQVLARVETAVNAEA
ncbi:MAG: response regulator receiver protein [Fibrobacteres bacterium]|nr:response regulator receiver protein [Fibrobacterota bacterium]